MWSLNNSIIYILTALFISAVWVGVAGIYKYKGRNVYIFGLNAYPLILWSLGLLVVRFVYDAIKHPAGFLIVTASYWLFLLAAEYVFYHYGKIQLDSKYPGLFGMDLMHAPNYSKAFYLLIGPAYLLITNGLVIELARMGLIWA
jgi:hypothetical protein